MNHIIKSLTLAVLLSPAIVFAQAGAGAMDNVMDRMAEELDLTDEQRAEIETIIEEQRRKQLQAREEAGQRIEGVLTEEQRAKLEEIQKQHQEEMARRMREYQQQQQQQSEDAQ